MSKYNLDFKNKKYSERTLKENSHLFTENDWIMISQYQILSENFIRKFQNEVNWDLISQYQILSEEFIREFQNKVNWENIFTYQILSKNFIQEFEHEINNSLHNQANVLDTENFMDFFKNNFINGLEKTFIWEKIPNKKLFVKIIELLMFIIIFIFSVSL